MGGVADGFEDIKAPAAQSASTGDYLVTLWNTTADESSLNLNQQVTGHIETPYRVDRLPQYRRVSLERLTYGEAD